VCIVGPPRDLGLRPLVRFGEELRRAAGARRVALIASADQAHAHLVEGPYGFDGAAAPYDTLTQTAALAGDLSALVQLRPDFIAAAKPDAPWQLAVLHGAMGGPHRVADFSYARPTYFGMLTARFDAT
jgi:aromatic ring-opening dioxygenase LigB subunit